MYFLDFHTQLILLFALLLVFISFLIKKKNTSYAKIIFIFGISVLVTVPLNLINESYIFIALFLGLPLLGVLMGYYQKGKDAIVSKFFYRFAIFMVVLYVVGFGLCLGL